MAMVTGLDVSYEHDENFFHHSFSAVVDDELGRTTTVTGTVFARYVMTPHENAHNNEGSVAVQIEGVPGVGHLEMQWQKPYMDYIRGQDYMRRQATPAVAAGRARMSGAGHVRGPAPGADPRDRARPVARRRRRAGRRLADGGHRRWLHAHR